MACCVMVAALWGSVVALAHRAWPVRGASAQAWRPASTKEENHE